jgi:hypothetical protein
MTISSGSTVRQAAEQGRHRASISVAALGAVGKRGIVGDVEKGRVDAAPYRSARKAADAGIEDEGLASRGRYTGGGGAA